MVSPAGTLLSSIFEVSGQGGRTARPLGSTGIETISRVNAFSKRLRVQLSEAIGQDLFCWPLHFLDKQVYQISTDIGRFRWCPECFAEMSQVGAPRYIKTALAHGRSDSLPVAQNAFNR